MGLRICLVGAGLTNATIAVELRRKFGNHLELVCYEARSHIGGNCHTTLQNGIWIHEYGPHVFHTKDPAIWNFVRSFASFAPYVHRVKASTDIGTLTLPVNLSTLSQILRRPVSPIEFRALIKSSVSSEGKSLGEFGRAVFGAEIFELLFQGYTEKQWGRSVDELPASVLSRLPVRASFDDNYFEHPFQGIPRGGYTSMIESMFKSAETDLYVGHSVSSEVVDEFDYVFWSGSLDVFFRREEGILPYRSVKFDRVETPTSLQGCAQMNYPSVEVPWTRITEHKYFGEYPDDDSPSVSFKEFSFETTTGDEPFYPVRLFGGSEVLMSYEARANRLIDKVKFVGRLGKFAYLDMDRAISLAQKDAQYFYAKIREEGEY